MTDAAAWGPADWLAVAIIGGIVGRFAVWLADQVVGVIGLAGAAVMRFARRSNPEIKDVEYD